MDIITQLYNFASDPMKFVPVAVGVLAVLWAIRILSGRMWVSVHNALHNAYPNYRKALELEEAMSLLQSAADDLDEYDTPVLAGKVIVNTHHEADEESSATNLDDAIAILYEFKVFESAIGKLSDVKKTMHKYRTEYSQDIIDSVWNEVSDQDDLLLATLPQDELGILKRWQLAKTYVTGY